MTTLAPFTGDVLAELPLSTKADVATAYDAARAAQRAWARRSVRDRAAVFLRLHDLVLDRQDEGLDIVQLETGKARRHAFEELADVALNARHYGRSGPRYLRTRRHPGLAPVLSSAHELRHPKGVVGIVSPWNYPLTLAVSDAIPAFIAGNAIVHKPDTQTALTALWVRSLAVEAGLPEALWQVVLGDGPEIGGAVVEGGDYVCFTGSTRVGREVAEKCARRLVGCSLELGGKNPMIVLADATSTVRQKARYGTASRTPASCASRWSASTWCRAPMTSSSTASYAVSRDSSSAPRSTTGPTWVH